MALPPMSHPGTTARRRRCRCRFFWDPVCPWAWLTSRWVAEVARLRDLTVDWRFICLRLVNADKDCARLPSRLRRRPHDRAEAAPVAAAVRDAEGPAPMGGLYTTFGGDIHVHGRRDEIVERWEDGFPEYLRSVDIDDRFVDAANDERWDEVLQADTDEALGRTGRDVGTPIVCLHRDGEVFSFFGPVISRAPRGEEALRLWDAVWEVATFPGFARGASASSSAMNAPPMHMPSTAKRSMPRWSITASWSAA